ncbi:MAG: DUF5103 domain-containing protein [Prevotellaceae bacterium]|jgi:hypothetical protein|nr:DUF5103 domain-containing protein [Prevotellaceae bacterium]
MRFFLIFLVLVISQTAYSQDIHSLDLQKINSKAKFKDFCFSDKISSVKLFKTGDQLSDPIIRLGSSETVTLVFDELIRNDENEENYYYSVEHRDADWKEESLITSDYMTGFSENDFNIVRQSMGTMVKYRNFSLTLPNTDVQLKISGNYVVKVFERGTQKLVLLKGFSVIEPLVAINASMAIPLNILCMQQLDIKVDHQSLKVLDSYSNLRVRVEQNSARVPGTRDPIPAFSQPNRTDYARSDRNMYNGRNEYRVFDIRSSIYSGQGVASRSVKDVHEVDLVHDKERSDYVAVRDINGKYMIGADNVADPDIQSDYVDVLFSFAPKILLEGRIFLYGELTNWSISEKYEMFHSDRSYKCQALLKQGFYNYQYVVMNKKGELDMNTTEGCFYETENEYNVYIYYRLPENRYDRLVGFQKVTSR